MKLKLTSMEGVAQCSDELASEDTAEHADGQEEGAPSGDPVVRQNRVLLLNHGDEPVLVWAVRVQYCPDAAPPEASACSSCRILSFSPRSPLGEFGSPSTACCFETETFPSRSE